MMIYYNLKQFSLLLQVIELMNSCFTKKKKFTHEMRKIKFTHTEMLFTHPHVVADMYDFLLRNTHVINPQNKVRHTCLKRV